MTTFFTADLHLGHANIIKYCERPFASVDAMNDALVDNWNRMVAPDDSVIVLGDLTLGPIARVGEWTDQLHGIKVLVPGNHDRCFGRPNRDGEYEDAGFQVVRMTELKGFAISHFPYVGDGRYAEHLPADQGRWLLHGHVHQAWRVRGRQINVGVDVWDYTPVSLDRLVALGVQV